MRRDCCRYNPTAGVSAKLTHLDMSTNFLEPEGGYSLATVIRGNGTLTSLNLASCYLKNDGVAAIANAVAHNTTLIRLNLADNVIQAPAARALAKCLAANTTLTWLNVGGVVADEPEAPAEEIEGNFAQASFKAYAGSFASSTGMGDDGVRAVAEALKHNRTLFHLDVCNNCITTAGIDALCAVVRDNSSLSSLVVAGNDIGEGGPQLADAVDSNTTLLAVDVKECKLLPDIESRIEARCRLNQKTTTEAQDRDLLEASRARAEKDMAQLNGDVRDLRRQLAEATADGTRTHAKQAFVSEQMEAAMQQAEVGVAVPPVAVSPHFQQRVW